MLITYVIQNVKTCAFLATGALGGDYWTNNITRAGEFETADEAQAYVDNHRWLNEQVEVVVWC